MNSFAFYPHHRSSARTPEPLRPMAGAQSTLPSPRQLRSLRAHAACYVLEGWQRAFRAGAAFTTTAHQCCESGLRTRPRNLCGLRPGGWRWARCLDSPASQLTFLLVPGERLPNRRPERVESPKTSLCPSRKSNRWSVANRRSARDSHPDIAIPIRHSGFRFTRKQVLCASNEAKRFFRGTYKDAPFLDEFRFVNDTTPPRHASISPSAPAP